VKRVKGEKSGHKGASSESAGTDEKEKKQKYGICPVKQGVDEMVISRVHSEERNVGHVGNPGQGMPVAGMKGPEGPENAFGVDSFRHGGVRRDISVIVHVEEIETRGLQVGAACNQE